MKFPVNDIISLLDERLTYNLAESTNKDLLLKEIWDDELEGELKNLKLEYGTSKGDPRLRRLISNKLGVDQEEIVVTNGSVFGILLSILCTCEQGDEVITVAPNFPPTMDLIDGLGFSKKLIRLRFEDNYHLNPDDVCQHVAPATKLIILVSPLNPTGTVVEAAAVTQISAFLEKNYPHCFLLIDETYREATYGTNEPIPSFAGLAENVITTSSLSKCHGTPGLRIGWLQSSRKSFVDQAKVAKMNVVISNSVLDELIAIKVLKQESSIFESRRIHSATGLGLTKAWVEKNTEYIEWIEPKAGALCCIKLKETAFSNEAVDRFYESAQVSQIQLADGQWFGESKRIFRLGFGYMEISDLDATLQTLSEILESCS